MRGGWAILWAGVIGMATGAVLVFTSAFLTGFFTAIIGVLAASVGAAIIAEPWHDECIDAEIDRWERNWCSTWTPECPIHGLNLCTVRTRSCPGVRDRMDA